MAGKKKHRDKKERRALKKNESTTQWWVVGLVVTVVVVAACVYITSKQEEETSTHKAAAFTPQERVQALTGFTPALFNMTPEQQAELDAWQPADGDPQLSSRAEYISNQRQAQRFAAATAAREAAETAGAD